MFNGDEIFGTRNPDRSWNLEITGTGTKTDGSWARTVTIKGASIEIEMSVDEPPNMKVMTTSANIVSKTVRFPLT